MFELVPVVIPVVVAVVAVVVAVVAVVYIPKPIDHKLEYPYLQCLNLFLWLFLQPGNLCRDIPSLPGQEG